MSETATDTHLDVPALDDSEPLNGTPDADPNDPGRAINPDTGEPYTELELVPDIELATPGGSGDTGRGAAAGGPAMGGGSSGPRTVVNFNTHFFSGWFRGWFSGNRALSPTVTTPIVRPKAIAGRSTNRRPTRKRNRR